MDLLWIGLTLLVVMPIQAPDPRRHWGHPQVPGPNLTFHKICLLPSLGKERVTVSPGQAGPVPVGRSKERKAQPGADLPRSPRDPPGTCGEAEALTLGLCQSS